MSNYTEDHLRILQEALASGITRVTYEGKTVDYDTLDGLQKRINTVRAQLAGKQVPRTVRFRTGRGF